MPLKGRKLLQYSLEIAPGLLLSALRCARPSPLRGPFWGFAVFEEYLASTAHVMSFRGKASSPLLPPPQSDWVVVRFPPFGIRLISCSFHSSNSLQGGAPAPSILFPVLQYLSAIYQLWLSLGAPP